jgi:pyruvate formate lyase activating enzyme
MNIGGLQKFSILDYPEHLSAIIFTQGCNFRCQFCYNPMLVLPDRSGGILNISSSDPSGEEIKAVDSQFNENDLFDFLKSRVGKLDAVVITGGEPTVHSDLPEFIKNIRQMGFKIKLDTNGTNQLMLESLMREKLLDYIAMDVKGCLNKYDIITGIQPNLDDIEKSIKMIIEGSIPYEFRTTVVPELVKTEDIEEAGKILRGGRKWYLQQFKSEPDLVNDKFKNLRPYSRKVLEEMREIGDRYVDDCEIR